MVPGRPGPSARPA